jgi:FlaA1/EpsC-like NDP-sugar epimerase
MHEVLINDDEMRYAWELGDKYVIFNPTRSEEEIRKLYPKIKKSEHLDRYSSDKVARISKNELKKLITKSGLLN